MASAPGETPPTVEPGVSHRALAIAILAGALALGGGARAQYYSHARGSYQDFLHDKGLAQKAAEAPPPPAAPSDGLSGGGFYLEADTLTREGDGQHFTADGHVQARYRGRTLRADRVEYNSGDGTAVATGHVQIIADDGTAQFADRLTLDKEMQEGFSTGFSTRLANNVQIAAARAHRITGRLTELDHVIFTPCPACGVHGAKAPTWSIRARRVIQDTRKKTLTFHDAVIQVKGQSVLYLPILTSVDPAADRKSGLLLPTITISGERGVSYQQPWYQVITPSNDITISPQLNTKVAPFLNLDYRQRFYSGVMDIRAGFTYDRDFTSGGDKFGPDTFRSYILGSGVFQLSPHWIWGFTAERTSDKLIFDKYGIGDVFVDRGLYASDDRRLISQLYAVRQDDLSYLSVAAINVQGLRANDLQSTFPTVAPLIEGRWEPNEDILGGRLRVNASAVLLTRSQVLPAAMGLDGGGYPAENSRRATAQVDWQRTLTFSNGLRVVPFLQGRADLYDVAGQEQLTPSGSTFTRLFGVAGATVSYPLVKVTPNATIILEPIAQLAISPNLNRNLRIPNEDSIDFQFDETNLFQPNRSPGFDLIEGGQSLTVGGRATVTLPDGRNGSVILGRRYSTQSDDNLPVRTGLQSQNSDYVFYADATPLKDVWLFSRLRLAPGFGRIDYAEIGARFATSRLSGYVSYVDEHQSPSYLPVASPNPQLTGPTVPGSPEVKDLDVHAEAFVTRNWGASGYVILDNGIVRRQDFGIIYRDDCIRVEVLYRHDETFNGTLGPSTSVVLRLTLATFGSSGYVADPRPGF